MCQVNPCTLAAAPGCQHKTGSTVALATLQKQVIVPWFLSELSVSTPRTVTETIAEPKGKNQTGFPKFFWVGKLCAVFY